MLFDYMKIPICNTRCRRCQSIVNKPDIPMSLDVSADGLPVGHEKEFILGVFEYCPSCGCVSTKSNSFDFARDEIILSKNRSVEEIASEIYLKHTVDSLTKAQYCEFFVGADAAQRYWNQYIIEKKPVINAEKLDVATRFLCADTCRRLGDFKKAWSILKDIKDIESPFLIEACKEEAKNIKLKKTERFSISRKYYIPYL